MRNYFSWWIENLGVVPLFLFTAFLLEPCFFNLFFLIAFVCLVFDPIWISSVRLIDSIKQTKITNFSTIVKVIALAMTLCNTSFAKIEPSNISLFISRGEQKAITAKNLKHYSIGNPEILNKTLKHIGGKLLIKGKKVGYTDIVIWNQQKKKTTYHIYVLSKKESLKLAQASAVLEDLGLKLRFKGKVLIVEGNLKSTIQVEEIHKLKKIFKNQILLRLKITPTLAKRLVVDIYKYFSSKGFSNYFCNTNDWKQLTCQYQAFNADKALEEKFPFDFIHFKHEYSQYIKKTLKLKLYFIQIEKTDGSEFSLGLNSIASNVKRFIRDGNISLIKDNLINFNNTKLKFQTLAKPEVNTPINTKGEINIGLEIPFLQTNSQSQLTSTQWKEAGFKFNYIIESSHERLKLKYKINFSSPSGENIAKSFFKGANFISMNKLSTLLHLQVKSTNQSESKIPIISQLPIIGNAFSSISNSLTTKYIAVFFEIIDE